MTKEPGRGFRALVAVLATLSAAGIVRAEPTPWFGVSFAGYEVGEALSAKGATGGVWAELAANVTATNAPAQGRAAIALAATPGQPQAAFTASAAAGGDLWTVEADILPEEAWDFGVGEVEGPVAVTFVADAAGTGLDIVAVVEGAWHRLTADGVTFAPGAAQRVRITAREIGGARYVGFAVVSGGEAVPLKSVTGTQWFAVDATRLAAISQAVFVGAGGRFSDFSAVRETAADEPVAMEWIGGAAGDWNDPANWSAGRVPASGETVRLAGCVTLTRGGETADVREALVRTGTDGGIELVAGDLRTAVSAGLDRFVPGRALTVTADSFAGVTPSVDVRWSVSRTAGSKDYAFAGGGTSFVPPADALEHWLRCEVTDAFGAVWTNEMFLSRLPVLYLTTDDGETPTAEKEEHDGYLFAQGNADWPAQYDGEMKIKVRGNSTSGRPKKPWKLKLASKAKMFGIDKSKHWVLLANWYDESMLRNKLAYDFANAIGSKGMRSTWVECVLNGAWQGCYLFCEQIRIAKDRVNVFNWEDEAEERGIDGGDEDFSWVGADEDVSGGYLFEFDEYYDERSKFTVTSGNLVLKTMLKSPEYLCTNERMMDWCQAFMQNYADAITSPDGYSREGLHYSAYCDMESMVSYFLVEEMFGNEDARCRSNYAYKERGQPMKFGPVWDFDWGVGNYQLPYAPEKWLCNYTTASFYREWADDPWFCTRLWTRYAAARAAFAEIVRDGGILDRHYAALREAGEANDILWRHTYGFKGGIYGVNGHPGLKQYLKSRLAWLDSQFRDVPTLMASLKAGTRETPSSQPYAADVATLPLGFVNAPRLYVCDGQDLWLSFTVGELRVQRVGVYVDGLRVGEPVRMADGRIDLKIPMSALTVPKGEPNCVSLVGVNTSGRVLARNYALVTVLDGTPCTTDAAGEVTVPSVPFGWILENTQDAVPSLAFATPEQVAAAAWQIPSPLGKSTPLWRDYVAGTNPRDALDRFRITSIEIRPDGSVALTWDPDLGSARVYVPEGRARLTEGKWGPLAPDSRFFRVRVRLP